VPTYTLNEEAVKHAKRLIDARRYVLRSRWQDVQPRAHEHVRAQNRPILVLQSVAYASLGLATAAVTCQSIALVSRACN